MKRNILTYGLILGAILAIQMVFWIQIMYKDPNFEPNAFIGYASMIVVFSMIFVGVRNYRNKFLDGTITFAKAFKMGAGIAFIAASMYVVTWLIYYYCFIPDFMEKYSEMVLTQAGKDGATAAEIAAKTKEMEGFGEMYKNPLFVVLLTYAEVLPVGLLIAAISALILKRKANPENNQHAMENQ